VCFSPVSSILKAQLGVKGQAKELNLGVYAGEVYFYERKVKRAEIQYAAKKPVQSESVFLCIGVICEQTLPLFDRIDGVRCRGVSFRFNSASRPSLL
jgi:hypothetical protein